MPPFGLYVMECTDVGDPEPPQNSEFGDTDQVKFTFKVLKVVDSDDESAEDFIGEETFAWANFTFGPKAKLRQWASALLARPIGDGEPIAARDLKGKRVRVTIGPNQNGKPKITNMMPYTSDKKKKAPATVAATPPANDFEGFDDDEEF